MKKYVSRRSFLKTGFTGLAAVAACGFLPAGPAAGAEGLAKNPENRNILIAYFSHSGNTRHMAEQIHERIGGDILKIETVTPYPEDYDSVVEVAKKEQGMNHRPVLATRLPGIESYDAVFIGYPNWWGTMPMAMFTFFEGNDFKGKTLIPFSTHEGSQFGQSISDMKRLNPQANILDGLAIRGRSVKDESTRKDIHEWLTRLNF